MAERFGRLYDVVELPLTAVDLTDETWRMRASLHNAALAKSIQEHGQKVPTFVERRVDGTFRVVAGFCRTSALKALGRETVLAIVLDEGDPEAAKIACLENAARGALTTDDLRYTAWKGEREGRNIAEQATRGGMSASTVRRIKTLGTMPQAVRDAVNARGLPMTHAATLGTALARTPKLDVDPIIDAWAEHGWGVERFRRELAKAERGRRRGRQPAGVRFDGRKVQVDLDAFDGERLTASQRKRLEELAGVLKKVLRGV